jgi:UDP-glucose 4-epimerase
LRLIADSERARVMLGFSPSVSLRDGLMRLKAWYESGGRSPQDMLREDVVQNWHVGESR